MGRHMEEVWDTVGCWLGILGKDGFGKARETLEACRELEQRTLFAAVREHLPYPELWADYGRCNCWPWPREKEKSGPGSV